MPESHISNTRKRVILPAQALEKRSTVYLFCQTSTARHETISRRLLDLSLRYFNLVEVDRLPANSSSVTFTDILNPLILIPLNVNITFFRKGYRVRCRIISTFYVYHLSEVK